MVRRSRCPVACTLDVLGDRWSLLVIRDIVRGKSRYGEFLDSPEGIPTNILADRLKRLHEGKRAFLIGDYIETQAALAEANVELRSRKLALVVALLRLAPTLVRRAYHVRNALLNRHAHVRS